MKLRSIKGFHDILPGEVKRWQFIEDTSRNVLELYGFEEIRIPHMEYTDLFARGIGTTTEIVEKEMYTFNDRDGSSISLRPEGTAGVVRSYIENSMHSTGPVTKLYYSGNMFRHERPQKGRYRSFSQIGAEYFGSFEPGADAEIISMLWHILENIGLTDSLKVEINSIGNPGSRKIFIKELRNFLIPHKEQLCDNCKRKLDTNPLRILDCKNPRCRELTDKSPSVLDSLSNESKKHFEEVEKLLDSLRVPYILNDKIVRGLDYYTETVFEITTDMLGSQNAVAAGGRYNDLMELIGGSPTPAVGFAMGMERLVLMHKLKHEEWPSLNIRVYIAWMGENAHIEALRLADQLRHNNISVEIDQEPRSLKSQMKRANRLNADNAIIIGEDELKSGKLTLRDMKKSSEEKIEVGNLAKIIGSIIGQT